MKRETENKTETERKEKFFEKIDMEENKSKK